MKEKLNITRPEVGWLSRVKLHDSKRPKPVEKPNTQIPTLPEPPSNTANHPEAVDSVKRTQGRLF